MLEVVGFDLMHQELRQLLYISLGELVLIQRGQVQRLLKHLVVIPQKEQ